MGAVLLVARAELRRRWRTLLGSGLLVVLFVTVVLTALVGAHRSWTSLDRFREWAGSSDITLQGDTLNQASEIEAAVAEEPAVVETALRHLANVFPLTDDDVSLPDFVVLSDPGGAFGVTVDRVRMLSGRMPLPDAPQEIVVNEITAELLAVQVGDSLRVLTFSAGDLEVLTTGLDFPGFNGPVVELEVVGIGRSPVDLARERTRTDLVAFGSPSFLEGNPGVGAWPPAVLLRLDDSEGGVDGVTERFEALLADATDRVDTGPSALIQTADDEYVDASERSVRGLALGLLIFAFTAAVAGFVAIGQAATRQVRAAAQDDRVLAALGLPTRQRALGIALPMIGVEAIAVLVAVIVAIASSPIMPTGSARRAEIDPGVWIDPVVLGSAAVALIGVLAGGTLWVAHRAQRAPEASPEAVVSSTVASRMISGLALGPTAATGLRRATSDGRRSAAGATRSAMVGVAIAAGGILGAGVIVSSIDWLESDPANWGWTWSTMPDAFGDDPSEALAADPDIRGAAVLTEATVQLGDTTMTGFSMSALRGGISFTLLDGRLPSSPIEVALGAQTMKDLGVRVGDSVLGLESDESTTRELEVVGRVVLPRTQVASLDEGAVFSPDGLTELSLGFPGPSIVLEYRPDADVAAVEARLNEELGLQFPVFARPNVPGSIANVAQARGIAWALAGFFGVLGVVGLFHALTVSTRRDGPDFAVLRTLGMRRRQVRTIVAVEALTIATVGLIVGVPLGLIFGRGLWRALVADLGIGAQPQMPWTLFALAIPLVLLVAVLTSILPGRRAAWALPAVQLRAE